MNLATRWFQRSAQQDTLTRVSTLPTLMRLGPNLQASTEQKKKEDSNQEKYFIAGESEVGGEEVVG